jgi:hypothetical protein
MGNVPGGDINWEEELRMQRFWKYAACAAAILLVAPGAALAQQAKAPAKAKATATRAAAPRSRSRTAGPAMLGGHPNLNGVWEVLSVADWNPRPHDAAQAPAAAELLGALEAVPPGLGVLVGETDIPYKAEARAQYEKNKASAPKADPEAACYLPGIPRATYIPHPFQIIQAADGDMLMAYQYAAANRLIKMQKVAVPPIDTWMGTSYGSWEGSTLKVDTLSQNGMTWLDRVGDYLSNNATVTERFTLMDHDHIRYNVTIDDPSVFSKPWKMEMILYRRVEPNAQILDFRCVPFADLLVYGDLLENKSTGKEGSPQ